MIEANEPTNGQVVKQETPNRITTSMITEDLENGIDRQGIQEKYGLESWEVKQMFQHPVLKGKKAKKVKKLSFEFVDDTNEGVAKERADSFNETLASAVKAIDPNQTSIPMSEEEVFTDLDEQSEEIEREMHYTPKETSTAVEKEFADGQEDYVDNEDETEY